LQVFAHKGAISLLFSRRDIHRSKVSSNFIKTCSQIHSEFGGTFTELKNPEDILGNKLPFPMGILFSKMPCVVFFNPLRPHRYLPNTCLVSWEKKLKIINFYAV
jgi:hypothetical protein